MKSIHQPLKNYKTSKAMIRFIEDTGSSDILNKNTYGPTNNGGHSFILVVCDNSGKFDRTIP